MPIDRLIAWRRWVLWLLALGFGGFGAAYAVRPSAMGALTGIALPSRTASTDFAATYGGAQLGLAVFLALCARRQSWHRVGLLAAGSTLAGIGGVRLVGIVLAGGAAPPVLYAGLAIELLGAALAFRFAA